MQIKLRSGLMLLSGYLFFGMASASAAVSVNAVNATNNIEYVDRLMIKMRPPAGVQIASTMATVMNTNQMATISGMAGVQMTYVRPMSGLAHVVKLPSRMPIVQARILANALANNPAVEYAEPDRWVHPMRVPNDPLYIQQWHYDVSANHGMNLPGAWDISIGAANVVTAVIDTGILPGHADFAPARILPGFDMITDPAVANDGNGRDANPSDTGDAVISNECLAIAGFNNAPSSSSWHG
ncbi:MAG: hypothetical protein Q9M16_02615, partial [Mariprofundus sp.]|nr:hypothetical protein [Mariprofundus sp.]